jgi:hypothetical protein
MCIRGIYMCMYIYIDICLFPYVNVMMHIEGVFKCTEIAYIYAYICISNIGLM